MSRRRHLAVRVAALLLAGSCRPLDLGGATDLGAALPIDAQVAADGAGTISDLRARPDLSRADLSIARDLDDDMARPDLAQPDFAPPPDFNCPGQISLAPQAIAFGKVPAGQMSMRVQVTLANVSGCFVLVRSGKLAGPGAVGFFLDAWKYPWWIAPGQDLRLGTWLDAPAGSYTASVEFETDVLAQPLLTIPITGTAVNGVPRIATDVPMIAFGAQVVGAMSNWQAVTITNNGPADLHITQVTLGGAMPGDFALDAAMLQQTVAMGSSTTVRAAFRPSAAGQRSADMVIASDDPMTPNLALPLTGKGQ